MGGCRFFGGSAQHQMWKKNLCGRFGTEEPKYKLPTVGGKQLAPTTLMALGDEGASRKLEKVKFG